MIRREFLKTLSLTAGASTFQQASLGASLLALDGKGDAAGVAEVSVADGGTGDQTHALFLNPPSHCRPMVRWWWNGDRVEATELLRELDVLQAAGIGGVEINPIKFPDGADPLQTKALLWLSDEWIDLLKVVLAGAKQRNLTADMIVGSGWPFGGEFLARADQTQMMALGTRTVSGPMRYSVTRAELLGEVSPAFVSAFKDPLKELVDLSLVPADLSSERAAVSFADQVQHEQIAIDVPSGEHVLYFLVKLTGFMAVINGAPGANGPVLNHFNADAVARYLNRLSDRLTSRIGPLQPYLRAFFTDSIELEGANWCDDMAVEFRRRRGYDLAPWLPFVLFKVGEMGNAVSGAYGARFTPAFREQVERVRYDFETLRRQLFGERFVATFVSWCRRLGVKSRMQAYGTECDVIAASMMLDIPECETWIRSERVEAFGTGDYRTGRNYTMINKFVSSAAHLSNKQLISCEEMTNTDDPFGVSLNRIKVAGDQSVLSGVTQSVLHGFNYSPAAAPFPGWVRYGTYFSERNTWWPYFKLWADYKARLSFLFQQTVMQADVAILPPFADLAARFGFQRDPFPQVAYPPYLFKLWEAVHANGSGCDYVNEDVLQRSEIKQGRIVFEQRSYKAILLAEVESLAARTEEKLGEFVRSGGTVLLLGKVPKLAPGLAAASEGETISAAMQLLQQQHPDRIAVVQVDESRLVSWFGSLQRQYGLAPDVRISAPVDFISQVHYADADRDAYFFANYSASETHTFTADFSARRGREAWLWDATTGKRAPSPDTSDKGALEMTLAPSESTLLVFETARVKRDTAALPARLADDRRKATAQEVSGPWHLELVPVDGTRRSQSVEDLGDAELARSLHGFAGTIIYKTNIPVATGKRRSWIDLGPLPHGVSEVWVNGESTGLRWYGQDHVHAIPGALTTGRNTLEIHVITTLGNYMKTLTGNRTAEIWTENTPFYFAGMSGPVRLLQL